MSNYCGSFLSRHRVRSSTKSGPSLIILLDHSEQVRPFNPSFPPTPPFTTTIPLPRPPRYNPPSLGGRQAVVVTKPLALCSYPAGALGFQPVNIPGSVFGSAVAQLTSSPTAAAQGVHCPICQVVDRRDCPTPPQATHKKLWPHQNHYQVYRVEISLPLPTLLMLYMEVCWENL